MWQTLIGIYLIVALISSLLLWSILFLGKKSEQKGETNFASFIKTNKGSTLDDQAPSLRTYNQISE